MNQKHLISLFKAILILATIAGYCFLLFWITGTLFEYYTDLMPISRAKTSFYFEPIVIFITFSALAIMTRRILLSLTLVTGFYIVFMLINAEMMRVFGLVFSPGDIKHSLQVFLAPEVWLSYWRELIFLVMLFALMVMMILKTKTNKILHQYRYYFIPALLMVVVLTSLNRYNIANTIKKTFRLSGKSIRINLSEHNGFLFGFYYQLLKHQPINEPANYSQVNIEKIVAKYTYNNDSLPIHKPHVIIFFIEAFADPKQSGIETSYNPIPNFRKYAAQSQSGLVLSPELGGRSANPEFELLTGLSMRFVPEKSIPYIDYVTKPFPSLAKVFNANGYTSHAIHVASMDYFNYKKAYSFLGFDYFYTLLGRNDIETDVAGRFPSENALVDEIINITENNESPQFIFSFPNSTHLFWDYDAYLDSDLEVYGDYIGNGNNHLKTYINAINTADKAIGKLIRHYEKNKTPTIVMVLGDHQPDLPEFRQSFAIEYFKNYFPNKVFKTRNQLRREFRKLLRENYHSDNRLIADVHRKSHQVPYLIWNNFDNKPMKKNTSMNLLSAPLLSISNVSKNPLYNLLDKIYNDVNELHKMTVVSKIFRTFYSRQSQACI